MKSSIVVLNAFIAALTHASAVANHLEVRACNKDNCLRVVSATLSRASKDCNAFLKTTVTPCPSTVTATASPSTAYTSVVVTSPYTTTAIVSSTATTTSTTTVVVTEQTGTTSIQTLAPTTTVVTVQGSGGQRRKRHEGNVEDLVARATSACPVTAKPTASTSSYYSVCTSATRFASACSCLGFTAGITTLPASTVTSTTTPAAATITRTIVVSSAVTATSTQVTTTTVTSTISSTVLIVTATAFSTTQSTVTLTQTATSSSAACNTFTAKVSGGTFDGYVLARDVDAEYGPYQYQGLYVHPNDTGIYILNPNGTVNWNEDTTESWNFDGGYDKSLIFFLNDYAFLLCSITPQDSLPSSALGKLECVADAQAENDPTPLTIFNLYPDTRYPYQQVYIANQAGLADPQNDGSVGEPFELIAYPAC